MRELIKVGSEFGKMGQNKNGMGWLERDNINEDIWERMAMTFNKVGTTRLDGDEDQWVTMGIVTYIITENQDGMEMEILIEWNDNGPNKLYKRAHQTRNSKKQIRIEQEQKRDGLGVEQGGQNKIGKGEARKDRIERDKEE